MKNYYYKLKGDIYNIMTTEEKKGLKLACSPYLLIAIPFIVCLQFSFLFFPDQWPAESSLFSTQGLFAIVLGYKKGGEAG